MEDPLGIGTKDTKRSESKSKKIKGINPTLENFNPITYLVHVHMNTPMEDILTGKMRLENKVTSRQKQLEFLVKDNFSSFVICKDAIDLIHQKIESELSDHNYIKEAQATFQALVKKSHELFDDLLAKQKEIDKIRNVLSILKRSQFIFNLPRRMRDNIAKGEYSKVVLNYKKVNSLVASASHASIKNVLSEVETIVKDLRKDLFESLQNPTLTLKQQEDIIGLLLDLGSPTDPAWFCIVMRYERIVNSLNEKFQAPNEKFFSLIKSSKEKSQIQIVSQILTSHLPDFWSLVKAYFDGTYHKTLSEERKKEIAVPNSSEELHKMMHNILDMYNSYVKQYLLGSDASLIIPQTIQERDSDDAPKSLGKFMTNLKLKVPRSNIDIVKKSGHRRSTSDGLASMNPKLMHSASLTQYAMQQQANEIENERENVLAILNLHKTLIDMKMPPKYTDIIGKLLDEAKKLYISDTFSEILKEAKHWHRLENWEIVEQHHMVTNLPNIFKTSFENILSDLEGIVINDDPIVSYIQEKSYEYINLFLDNMHHLAMKDESSSRQLENDEEFSKDSKLLIILNNLAYTRVFILPILEAKFEKECKTKLYWSDNENVRLIKHLENMILNKYLLKKTQVLNIIIRNGLVFTHKDWDGKTLPKDIRDYVLSLLVNFVITHDELYRISKSIVHVILSMLLENVFQTIYECVSMVEVNSIYDSVQVGIELDFISFIMRKHKTPLTKQLFDDIDDMLQYSSLIDQKSSSLTMSQKKEIRSIITTKQSHTSLMFACFNE